MSDIDKGTISVFLPERGIKKQSARRPIYPNSVQWLSLVPNVIGHKIIWGRDGKAYVISKNDHTISIIKDNAVEKKFKIPKCEPVSIAQDMEGGLWVLDGDSESVMLVDTEGNILRKFGSGGSKEGYLSNPTDLVISSKGVVLHRRPGQQADSGVQLLRTLSADHRQGQGEGTDPKPHGHCSGPPRYALCAGRR